MMPRKLTIQHSAIAYILNKEMGYTQKAISILMKTSQPTISNMIKEFELKQQINNLKKELDEARSIIKAHNLLPQNNTYFID